MYTTLVPIIRNGQPAPLLQASPQSLQGQALQGLGGFTDDVLAALGQRLAQLDETIVAVRRIDQNVEILKPWVPIAVGALAVIALGLLLNARKR